MTAATARRRVRPATRTRTALRGRGGARPRGASRRRAHGTSVWCGRCRAGLQRACIHYISTNFDTSRLALSLRFLLPVLEPRCGAEHLVVQPAIDDALPKAPLLPQLGRRNPLLLRPLVDGLRCEPEVRRDLFDGQNVVVERRCAALVAVPGHGRLRRRVVSASVSASGSTRPRNRGSVSGLTDAAVGLSSPCISLFTA